MTRVRPHPLWIIVIVVGGTTLAAAADPDPTIAALGADDVRDVARAVEAIAGRAARASDPDVLFAAARACEVKLLDPARAAAIYERIVADHPAARVAPAAARRITALRALVGEHGEAAAHAAELAQLVAGADALPPVAVVQRGELLSAAPWPGAPDATLWLADWLRRSGRVLEAQAHYAVVVARWPALPQAHAALRGAAGCALDAHDWSLADALARRLPVADAADRITRDELVAVAAHGRRRDRGYLAAWLAIGIALVALLGSLVEAIRRRPAPRPALPDGAPAQPAARRPALPDDAPAQPPPSRSVPSGDAMPRSSNGTWWAGLRPPIEVMFLGPVALVLLGVAFTAHRAIAPAVATIALGGLALAWLSGAALELVRASGRSRRLRSLAHLLACLAGVAGLTYVALTRGDLIDLLIETVRFGVDR
jgi:hypothetical protein